MRMTFGSLARQTGGGTREWNRRSEAHALPPWMRPIAAVRRVAARLRVGYVTEMPTESRPVSPEARDAMDEAWVRAILREKPRFKRRALRAWLKEISAMAEEARIVRMHIPAQDVARMLALSEAAEAASKIAEALKVKPSD